MCKVAQYQFSCEHYFKLCRSRCGGTRCKTTRSKRTKAACCAEAYITIKLPFDCNKCQQDMWITCWKKKLERASTFRDKLVEKHLPGAAEVAQLVKNLEDEYEDAAWHLRKLFPQATKPNIDRPKPTCKDEKRVTSLLKEEVQPHEVMLPGEMEQQEEHDDTDDYERSTDPFHPITMDYSHPLDGVDDSYLLDHFTSEELASSLDGDTTAGFDPGDSGWDWGGYDCTKDSYETASNQWEGAQEAQETNSGLIAWGPEADQSFPAAEINMNGLRTVDDAKKTQIEQTLKAFWKAVDDDTDKQQELQRPCTPSKKAQDVALSEQYETHFRSDNCNSDPSVVPDCPLDSEYIWTDGAASEPPSPPRPSNPPSPNSTRAKYDKMRRAIQKYLVSDPRKYYALRLQLSRMEIRDFVGPEGEMIYDPK